MSGTTFNGNAATGGGGVLFGGATNLTNKYYYTGFGSPGIGGVYYATFAYNVF